MTRGGPTRVRILSMLNAQPRNASQLADRLTLTDKTVHHHLSVFTEHGLVHSRGGEYGAVYLLTDQAHQHWETIETITQQRQRPLIDRGFG